MIRTVFRALAAGAQMTAEIVPMLLPDPLVSELANLSEVAKELRILTYQQVGERLGVWARVVDGRETADQGKKRTDSMNASVLDPTFGTARLEAARLEDGFLATGQRSQHEPPSVMAFARPRVFSSIALRSFVRCRTSNLSTRASPAPRPHTRTTWASSDRTTSAAASSATHE